MKKILFLLLLSYSFVAKAGDDPKAIIRELNKKFTIVNDYKADVFMQFKIPGVKLHDLKGKVIYKQPNKFRIKAKGIFFLPKQNPMQSISALLLDTNAYTSIISGYEIINGNECAIVNIIPLKSNADLILGKFWVDKKKYVVHKSQITTKDNGTFESQSFYDNLNAPYSLPTKTIVKVEVGKMKMPKMLAIDLNKKSKPKDLNPNAKETGIIELYFTNYVINKTISDKEFEE